MKEVLSLDQIALFHQEGCSLSLSRTLQTKHTHHNCLGIFHTVPLRTDTTSEATLVARLQNVTLISSTQKSV